MSHEIVLFHSALGRTPAVLAWADQLRAAGHTVHTPDFYDGEVFTDLAEGARKRDALGIPAMIERAQAAVADLPERLVYAGFSMGAAAAEFLAVTRPGARAAVLMHGAVPVAMTGAAAWPRGVAALLHYSPRDPWIDVEQVEGLEADVRASDSRIETFVYPGEGHLFADDSQPEYDAPSARLMMGRTLAFLASLT